MSGCELLIRSDPHPSPKVDPGDIVDIKPAGADWGRREKKAAFLAAGGRAEDWDYQYYIVNVPDLAEEDAKHVYGLLEPIKGTVIDQTGDMGEIGEAFTANVKNRRWAVNLAALPPDLVTEAERDGEITTDFATGRHYVIDKLTGDPL